MSIETLIQENTAAIRDLTAAIRAMIVIPAASAASPEAAEPAKAKSSKAKPAPQAEEVKQEAAAPVEAAVTAPAESNTPVEAAEAEKAYTYDEVADLVRQLATKKGRDAAVAVLGEFGVQNAKALAEDKWPAFVAKAEFRLAQE